MHGFLFPFVSSLIVLLVTPPLAGKTLPSAKTPVVSRIAVAKNAHTMTLYGKKTPTSDEEMVATYRVAIGPGGAGVKKREGDEVTPVGRYHIVHKKPSKYRVFMLLDYPNAEDRARFEQQKATGAIPKDARIGGDVGIHGAPPQPEWKSVHKETDWTLGCIAVDDDEIEAIAKIVPEGTVVDIRD